MNEVSQEKMSEIRNLVYEYFAEECDIDADEISDSTNIITELDGDSLMLLSLLEICRKKYGLSIELKTLDKRLMKEPADTVGQIVDLTVKIVQHGDDLDKLDQ